MIGKIKRITDTKSDRNFSIDLMYFEADDSFRAGDSVIVREATKDDIKRAI